MTKGGLAGRLTEPHGSTLREAGRLVATTTAIVSMAAGLIHVSAAVDHRDMTGMFAGFLVFATLQVALAFLLLWRRPRPPLLAAGVVLMVVAVGLWVVSRTAGLPVVGAGEREAIGVADGITVLFELAAIPGLFLLMSRELATMSLPSHRLGTRAVSLVGAGAFMLMTPALILGDRHGSGLEVDHGAGGHAARAGATAHARDAGGHPGGTADAGHRGGGSGKHARARHSAKLHATGGGHAGHSGSTAVVAVLHRHGSGSSGAGHGSTARGHREHRGSDSGSTDPHRGHHGSHPGSGTPSPGGQAPDQGGGGGGQPTPQQQVEALIRSLTGVDPPR